MHPTVAPVTNAACVHMFVNYVRANTCVACHQNVDADLLQAGHPELIFELDGQAVTQPKHWRETTNWNGAQAWWTGQSAALREMSWQITNEKSPTENQVNRWEGLIWLFNQMEKPKAGAIPSAIEEAKTVQQATDAGAKYLFDVLRDKGMHAFLSSLASASADFRDSSISQPLQARRAERLVLALDRLVTALPELDKNEPVQSALKQLFKDAQSLPDFNPTQFAEHLSDFQKALTSLAPSNK